MIGKNCFSLITHHLSPITALEGELLSLERTPQQERLTAIVRRFPQSKIVVVGDLVADQFLYGEISRVSREAPVLILHYERTETTPGGAANCASNLAALDAKAVIIGVTGEDEAGSALVEKLREAAVDCGGIVSSPSLRTTTKVRVLAGQTHSTRQQVIRIDYEGQPLADDNLRAHLRSRMREEVETADAVIISDYNYGLADAEMVAAIREATHERGIPMLVDSRFGLARFTGLTSATPNEDEVEHVLNQQFSDVSQLETAGAKMRERLDYRALLVTRGSQGMLLLENGVEPLRIEAVGAREAVDVTGAGDTVIATYALALASGATFADAAHLANHAGGLVVMKRGTATINRQELLSSVLRWGEA
ncbi:MAG: D-glycero-beta-D-manno-heptose-7-phosphate kinase [Acidobacteriota bacterium]|nr:D-glycero-beta-D-manno-heptose-7-phosphate kinase [Acidobacteriota bacterium]